MYFYYGTNIDNLKKIIRNGYIMPTECESVVLCENVLDVLTPIVLQIEYDPLDFMYKNNWEERKGRHYELCPIKFENIEAIGFKQKGPTYGKKHYSAVFKWFWNFNFEEFKNKGEER